MKYIVLAKRNGKNTKKDLDILINSSKLWYGVMEMYRFTQTGQWELRIDFNLRTKPGPTTLSVLEKKAKNIL